MIGLINYWTIMFCKSQGIVHYTPRSVTTVTSGRVQMNHILWPNSIHNFIPFQCSSELHLRPGNTRLNVNLLIVFNLSWLSWGKWTYSRSLLFYFVVTDNSWFNTQRVTALSVYEYVWIMDGYWKSRPYSWTVVKEILLTQCTNKAQDLWI